MENYYGQTVHRRKVALLVFASMIASFVLFVVSLYYIQSKALAIIFAVGIVLPAILLKKILDFFKCSAEIIFAENSFSITERKKNNEEINYEFDLDDIGSYRIQFVNRIFAEISIFRKFGTPVHFTFFRELEEADQRGADQLMNIFNQFIKAHNSKTPDVDKIHLVPSFYASPKGLITIFLLVFLLIIASTLHVIYSIKTIPISLFLGCMLIIQIAIRRNTDMKFYNEMK